MSASDLRVVGLAVLAGCGGHQSAFEPRGPQAERLHDLWLVMLVGGAVVFLVVFALVVAAVALPRDGDRRDDRRRLRLVGIGAASTAAILVALLVYNVRVSAAIAAIPADAVMIRVTGHQWWWDVTYPGERASDTVRTANEIWIPVGRPVAIELESRDVIHSFWVPNLHGKVDAIPGRWNRLWLQADTEGVWRGQCAEFCGLQHAKMAFVVVAVPPARFEAWLDEQRRPAAAPANARQRAGQDVFLQSPCVLCHAVRGTPAAATVGPDLTHLASRRTIGAGILPNTRGHLAGWILDAQHVKPGSFMPSIDLEGDRLHVLLDYLESLR